ncbi:MAG: hypothetical protein ABL921_05330 [Pirellula sp.]
MSELASFHEFLSHKVKDFGTSASPEEMLDLWRSTHPSELDFRNDVKALQYAIDEMKAGDRGIRLPEFDTEFRKKHSID